MCEGTETMKRCEDGGLRSLGKTRDALYAVDNEQRIIYWNEGARKLLGYSEQEVLGKPCWRIIAGRRGKQPWCKRNCRVHRCVMRDGLPPHHYFETRTKKGQSIWVGVSVLVLKVDDKPISAHMLTSVPREERLRQTLRRMQGSVQIDAMPLSGPRTSIVSSPKRTASSRETGRPEQSDASRDGSAQAAGGGTLHSWHRQSRRNQLFHRTQPYPERPPQDRYQ